MLHALAKPLRYSRLRRTDKFLWIGNNLLGVTTGTVRAIFITSTSETGINVILNTSLCYMSVIRNGLGSLAPPLVSLKLEIRKTRDSPGSPKKCLAVP